MRTTPFKLPLSLLSFGLALAACSGGGSPTPQPVDTSGTVTVEEAICGESAEVKKAPTYAEDIAPILMKNCAQCHQTGGIAPFPLLTYDETKPLAGLIKDRTAAREMPPFNPNNCGHCNTFQEAKWLDAEEIALISAWADSGAAPGDLTKAPPAPAPPEGLKEANKTIDMGVSYTPDASKVDDYRCFVVDPGLTADAFLTAYEVMPGEKRVVHHVIAFALDNASADAEADANDAAEAGPGYTCYGGPGVAASRFVAGWAPGGGPTRFPAGTGLKLEAGRKMVLQIHYNLASGALPDQTKLAVALAPSVDKEASITRIAAKNINLPPGQPLVTATNDELIPALAGTVTIWGVAPHMHVAGKTMNIESDHSGQKQCLLDVGNWDFHWQSFSMYDKPLTVQGGDTIRITCGYDTTGRDNVTVSGEGTEDEMCIGFFYVTR